MNLIIDVTYRIKVRVEDNKNPSEVLKEINAQFTWPEGFPAQSFSEEIMHSEIVDIKLPPMK